MMEYLCRIREDGAILNAWIEGYEPDGEKLVRLELKDFCLADDSGEPLYQYKDGVVSRRNPVRDKDIAEMKELEDYLSSTDWYVYRKMDSGDQIPKEVSDKRKDARLRISEIRAKWANLPTLENA